MESAISYDPHSSFLNAKLAEVLIELKDLDEAESVCKSSLELNPDNADAYYLLGRLKLTRSDWRNAIGDFRRATELKPDYFRAQYYLASLLFKNGDYNEAAHPYSEMVRVKPYDPDLRLNLGICYYQSGKTVKAIKEFDAVTKLREDYLEPHFYLAYLYARQSRNREAIQECLIVLRNSPWDPNMNLLLAELYVSIDEFDKAITICQKLLRQRGIKKAVSAEAHYRIATAYKGKGQDNLADLSLQKSLSEYKEILEEGNVGAHYDIAIVYDAKGDELSLKLAEQHLRNHIELRPNEPNAYNFLGYMFVENNVNLEEAADLIKEAVAMEPENGAFRDSLGWAYFKLGNVDGAIAELEKAAEFMPDDSEIREHLGEVYLKRGKDDSADGSYIHKAISQWEQALEKKPRNALLRQKLDELRKSLESPRTRGKENGEAVTEGQGEHEARDSRPKTQDSRLKTE